MHVELSLSLATLYGFLLVLARVSGVIAFVPLPGFPGGAEASRIVLALALSVTLFPVWPAAATLGEVTFGRLLGWIASELAVGMTVGIAVAFLIESVQLGAQVIGLEAGYSYASMIDPNTQADSNALQMVAQLIAGSLFFALGFDRQVIQVLGKSFDSIPSGTYFLGAFSAEPIIRLGAGMFVTGLQLAIPVLALLLLLDIAFAVLGRVQSQLQLLSLSFSLKMLAAIGFLAAVLAFYPPVLAKVGAHTFTTLLRMMSR